MDHEKITDIIAALLDLNTELDAQRENLAPKSYCAAIEYMGDAQRGVSSAIRALRIAHESARFVAALRDTR